MFTQDLLNPGPAVGVRGLRTVRTLSAILVACVLVIAFPPAPAQAQVTRADSAAVLLDLARTFEAERRVDLAEEILDVIIQRFPDTPAGAEAVSLRITVRDARLRGRGQAGYVVWSTIFGAWMGFAIPAALGADEPEPYGVGLLLGAPIGFFGSRAYGRSVDMSVGASRTITFAWMWGSWQAIGWRNVLDLGDDSQCSQFGCVPNDDDEANWKALVVGGLGGYAAGIAATRAWDVSTGAAEMIWHSSIWATGYGFSLGYLLADLENDDLWATALVAGNVGLAASIPASNAWQPTSGQVRLVSAAGVAGGVAGLGVDLLASVDDEKVAVAIPTIGATIGLVAGALLTARDEEAPGDERAERDVPDLQTSLLRLDDGLRLGLPAPVPTMRLRLMPDGTELHDPGVELTLMQLAF